MVLIAGVAIGQSSNTAGPAEASPSPNAAAAPNAQSTYAMPDYRNWRMQDAVNDLNNIGLGLSLTNPASANLLVGSQTPAPGTSITSATTGITLTPAAPAPVAHRYTLRLSGTAKRATVAYSVNGSSAGGIQVGVPWSRDMNADGTYNSASLSAFTASGSSGNLTCTILDETGTVLATKTAQNEGGEYGSAMVSCFGN